MEPIVRADEREGTVPHADWEETVLALGAAKIEAADAKRALADLRAKVEGLRDQWQAYLDSDPTSNERPLAWSRVDTLQGVLALLDEVQP